jgi:hypothetical protein
MRDSLVGKWFITGSETGSCDNGMNINYMFSGVDRSVSLYAGPAADQLYWDSTYCSLKVSGSTAKPDTCKLPSSGGAGQNGMTSSTTQTLNSLQFSVSSNMLTMSESSQDVTVNMTGTTVTSTVTCNRMTNATGVLDRTDLGMAPTSY